MRPLRVLPHALCDQLPVGGGDALVRIELVGGFHAEQRLEARHNGNGDAEGPHRAASNGTEIREAENATDGGIISLTNHRQLHQLLQREATAKGGQVDAHTDEHRHQGSGQNGGQRQLLHEGTLPQDEGGQAQNRDEECRWRDVVEHQRQLTKGVLSVCLLKRHVAFGVGVVPQRMRNLLEKDDDADARQHALDHTGRKVESDDAGFERTQNQLNESADDHREQKDFVAGQGVDAIEDNDGEASRWARDANCAARNGGDDEATKDTGNEPSERGSAGGQGNAEAQWEGDEKNDDGRRKVLLEVLEHENGDWKQGEHRDHRGARQRGQCRRGQPCSGGSQMRPATKACQEVGSNASWRSCASMVAPSRCAASKASNLPLPSFSSGPSRSSSELSSDSSASASNTQTTPSPFMVKHTSTTSKRKQPESIRPKRNAAGKRRRTITPKELLFLKFVHVPRQGFT